MTDSHIWEPVGWIRSAEGEGLVAVAAQGDRWYYRVSPPGQLPQAPVGPYPSHQAAADAGRAAIGVDGAARSGAPAGRGRRGGTLTIHQRRLLARLCDPMVKIQQGPRGGYSGTPGVYVLCRWNGSTTVRLARPAPGTVEPLIAAGYLMPVKRRHPWLANWWEISAAGRAIAGQGGSVV